ncbi:MAG: glycosyltransferase family 1 protein [Chloroflexi bacterium]|nr:glycosyltransferase family 1 protein [Chloroflexota bacterium]
MNQFHHSLKDTTLPISKLRLLFISEGYPPTSQGGYEQLCQEVNHNLMDRGHQTHVLTGTDTGPSEPHITRDLFLEVDERRGSTLRQFWQNRLEREEHNIHLVNKTIARFQPDLLYIWSARNLPRRLLWHVENLDLPVVYYLAGYWPTLPDTFTAYWQRRSYHPLKLLIKQPAAWLALRQLKTEGKPFPLRFSWLQCVSHAVLDAIYRSPIRPMRARVIYNGIDLDTFSHQTSNASGLGSPIRLLYAGRLTYDKGVYTIVEAMRILKAHYAMPSYSLTFVGDGPAYFISRLKTRVHAYDLEPGISFQPAVSREQIPALLRTHDVLLFPSRDEAMPRMVQEAMACGLVVIGTTIGGTKELLKEGQTGLTFAVDDAAGLAAQISRLAHDPGLYQTLVAAGQAAIRQQFTIRRMIDEIEADLMEGLDMDIKAFASEAHFS